MGDIVAAETPDLLRKLNIKIVISLIKGENKEGIKESNDEIKEGEKEIKYYNFGIDDDRNENISALFPTIINLIEENKDNNILIHCYNAVSRSVTILLAYLKEGIELIKSKRNVPTRPNIGFMKQLIKYERETLSYNSLKLSDYI